MTRRDFWWPFALTGVVCLLPMLVGLILWPQLPAEMPIHWNAAGEVDGYASRAVAVFALPGFLVLINALGHACLWRDSRAHHAPGVMLALGRWVSPILSVLATGSVYASALGAELAVERIVPTLVGVLVAIIGNYLPKCRPNRTIGIRVPWTLASEENWTRTHRLGGWLFLAGGIVIAVAGFCGFVGILIWAMPVFLVPIVYSYILHRRGI